MKRTVTANEPLLRRDVLWRWSLNLGQKKKEENMHLPQEFEGGATWMRWFECFPKLGFKSAQQFV